MLASISQLLSQAPEHLPSRSPPASGLGRWTRVPTARATPYFLQWNTGHLFSYHCSFPLCNFPASSWISFNMALLPEPFVRQPWSRLQDFPLLGHHSYMLPVCSGFFGGIIIFLLGSCSKCFGPHCFLHRTLFNWLIYVWVGVQAQSFKHASLVLYHYTPSSACYIGLLCPLFPHRLLKPRLSSHDAEDWMLRGSCAINGC